MTQEEIHYANSGDGTPGLFLMTNSFETGGSERQFVALARSVNGERFRVRVGCISRQGSFLEGFDEVSQFPVGGNLYGAGSMRTRLRLARYLRRSDIEIAHAFDFYTNLLLIPAAKLAGVPVIVGSQRQLGDLLTPAKSRAQMAVLRWCDRVVCNSRAAAERLITQGMPREQITVIGNGLAASAFAPTTPALPRSRLFRVAMIARMNAPSKNHGLFLKIAARIHHKFPGIEFLLAGDGPLKPELERLAQDLGISQQVHFLGDRRDIPAILASVDLSVLPSASESLSNAILESMAAGVPVVAADVGGNAELLGGGRGVLVPGDEHSFSHAMEKLLLDEALRAEYSRSARMFAEANFTIASVGRSHEELYSELLNEKIRRSSPKSCPPNRLRVAIIAASSRYVGGQSVQADLIVKSWQNDQDVEAIQIPIDPRFPIGLKWAESIPFVRTIIRQPIYLWTLWRDLRQVDIAHIFSASYWSFLIAPLPALVIAHLMGKKTLVHYHSGEARDHLQRFPASRSMLARTGMLVVPSEYLLNVFREFGLEGRVVPNLVDLSQFSNRARRQIRPHFLCTRGFHPYYSVDLVVRAFAEVKQAYPDARLDLVGTGPLEASIRGLVAELGLTDVAFLGVASRQEIGEIYDRADIFINGSHLDNMPVSILEAFASGMPVVSTAPEGIRYLVAHEQSGLLSSPGDAHELAQNAMRILSEPALTARMVSNAYEQSKNYRWTAVRGQWLEIYRSLFEQSREEAQQAASIG